MALRAPTRLTAAYLAGLLLALTGCQKAEQIAQPEGAASVPSAAVTGPVQVPLAAASAAPHGPSSEGLVTGFHATGVSPAWSVDVQGDELRILVPELVVHPDSKPVVVIARHLAYAKGVNFEGAHEGVKFVLDIRSGPCDKATEAGKLREFHATFDYGQRRYTGCADGLR